MEDRHASEILTDNTQIQRCNQCKDCAFWGNSNAFSNEYDKLFCDMFEYPQRKPRHVIDNLGECEYFMPRQRS